MRYPFPQSPKPSYRRPHSSASHDRDPPTLAKRPRCSRPLLLASNSRRREGPHARAVWAARASRLVMRLVIRDDYFISSVGSSSASDDAKSLDRWARVHRAPSSSPYSTPPSRLHLFLHGTYELSTSPRSKPDTREQTLHYTTLHYTTLHFFFGNRTTGRE